MEDGRPFLDMAHVITSLNRLDAGIPDKVLQSISHVAQRHYPSFQVCLMSRDELNVLVVSYAELKNCLEQVQLIFYLQIFSNQNYCLTVVGTGATDFYNLQIVSNQNHCLTIVVCFWVALATTVSGNAEPISHGFPKRYLFTLTILKVAGTLLKHINE